MNTVDALPVTLDEKRIIARDVVELTLRGVEGALPTWVPGAHIDLQLPNWLRRQYSLCGDPADSDVYRIAVGRERLSRGGSEYIHDYLTSGRVLEISAPRVTFSLKDASRYLFIAGGIGITPILPMVRAAGHLASVVYAGRSRSRMAYLSELASAAADVRIYPEDEIGRPDLSAIAEEFDGIADIYCCGPEPLLSAIEAAFDGRSNAIHVERFRPKPRTFAPNTAFQVECLRSGERLEVAESDSVLDVLARNGMGVVGGCREGVCGTCRLRVVDGQPDHRDEINDDAQYFYPCVSRSFSQTLVVDV